MLKAFLFAILGLALITGSCFEWSRVGESGVLTQETCADNRKPGCVDPEDIPDSVAVTVDSVTGDTVRTVVSRRMWAGHPNGMGYVFLIAGLAVVAYAAYSGLQAHRKRGQAKTFTTGGTAGSGAAAWTCKHCGTTNDAKARTCLGCGHGRPV